MKQASLKQGLRLLGLVEETGWRGAEVQRRLIERWGLLRDIAMALDDPQLSEDKLRAMHPLFYRKAAFGSFLSACRQDWVDPDFNEENFPLEPVASDEDDWEVVEYHFDRTLTGKEAFRRLEKLGYRLLGGSRRAMEFLAAHPDLQDNHPLVITVRWQHRDGDWNVPIADRRGDERKVPLVYFDYDFPPRYGWLVLRRKAEKQAEPELPTEITVGGVTYEIFSFLREGEDYISGEAMVKRAKRMNANLGQEDCEFLLAHEDEIPVVLRNKVSFVFPDWRRLCDCEERVARVACVRWGNDGSWSQDWDYFHDWSRDFRLLRRKAA